MILWDANVANRRHYLLFTIIDYEKNDASGLCFERCCACGVVMCGVWQKEEEKAKEQQETNVQYNLTVERQAKWSI